MTTPAKHPNVLLVVGAARSGSTLVSMLLGATEGVCNAGEISHYWDRGLTLNHFCGCGVRVRSCGFWNAVAERAGFDLDPAEAERANVELRQCVRRYSVWRPGRPDRTAPSLERTRRLYASIAESSGSDWIVDSSKQPIYARYLIDALGRDRVHVLHIVRDPRGVAYSAAKRRLKADAGDGTSYMVQRGYSQSALNWVKVQLSAEALRRSCGSYHRLRYEDLCAAGEAPLADILRDLDAGLAERFSHATTMRARGGQWGNGQHTVSGNPIRVAQGALSVKIDDRWKTDLPKFERSTVSAIAAPLLLRYHYPLV